MIIKSKNNRFSGRKTVVHMVAYLHYFSGSLIARLLVCTLLCTSTTAFGSVEQGYGITAHRGNSSDFPENTLPAFESAIALRVDWAELDIHLTKDNKVVVIHDSQTGRVGDKDLKVADHTYEELKTVDVAHGFRTENQIDSSRLPKQTIPLLEEVLQLFSKSTTTRISIQPKTDCIEQALEIIRRLEMCERVGFNDGNLKYMAKVKRLAPEIPVFWDRPESSDIDEDIRIAKQNGFESLVCHQKGLTSEKIRKIKAAGMEVGVWTVNDTKLMKDFLGAGVQRFYTDEPQKLLLLREDPETIFCEGRYRFHLQGICEDDRGNIFWSWTDKLVKTDKNGKELASVAAPSHQGDLCYRNGFIYVAVNLGKFNEGNGTADSWVYQFDAQNLTFIKRIPLPELEFGAGGMEAKDDRFIVVGGLRPDVTDNQVYEYDSDFRFLRSIPIGSGYTLLGIQTIAYGMGTWLLGCYGNPAETLICDEKMQLKGRNLMDTSLGIVIRRTGKIVVGSNRNSRLRGHLGFVREVSLSDLMPKK